MSSANEMVGGIFGEFGTHRNLKSGVFACKNESVVMIRMWRTKTCGQFSAILDGIYNCEGAVLEQFQGFFTCSTGNSCCNTDSPSRIKFRTSVKFCVHDCNQIFSLYNALRNGQVKPAAMVPKFKENAPHYVICSIDIYEVPIQVLLTGIFKGRLSGKA